MVSRRTALLVLSASLLLTSTAAASSAEPLAGTLLTGKVRFPRPQGMTLRIDNRDTSRLTAAVGFDGRCRGGGLAELWAAYVPARQTVRVRKGTFKAVLTGETHDVGGATGRTGKFRWTVSGRFTAPDAATASVKGTAVVRARGHVVSRCKIGRPAHVRLSIDGG